MHIGCYPTTPNNPLYYFSTQWTSITNKCNQVQWAALEIYSIIMWWITNSPPYDRHTSKKIVLFNPGVADKQPRFTLSLCQQLIYWTSRGSTYIESAIRTLSDATLASYEMRTYD